MTDQRKPRPTDADHLGNSYSPDRNGRRDRSIFNVDVHWRRSQGTLPSIQVSEPTGESAQIENSEELYTTPLGGRYPILMFPEESPQPAAEVARTFGYSYYYEGLTTPGQVNRGKRIDCFRASELLYLHALTRGSIRAHVGIGKIYLYDLAEGHYFDALGNNLFANAVLPEEQIRRKAHDHLAHAAKHGDAEGTYLYGDVLHDGCGCDVDMAAAFGCYQDAYRMVDDMASPPTALRGCVAMRLGRAYEEGEGCEADYATALQWYETAVLALQDAVDNGGWFCDVDLGRAIRGAKRMRQELALSQ